MAFNTIRSQADGCLDQFKLLRDIELQVQGRREVEDFEVDECNTADQLARFYIWAGNIGVFADGHASIDHRLRDNSDAKKLMNDFLASLKGFLQRATEELRTGEDQTTVPSPLPSSHESLIESFNDRSASSLMSPSFNGTDTDSVPDFSSQPPFQQRMNGVERSIDRLYRLSVLIRQPSVSGQNNKAERYRIRDDDGTDIDDEFTSYALRFVTHKFPAASEGLRYRLAKGITVRRRRFLYRQNHQKKLSTRAIISLSEGSKQTPGDLSDKDLTVRGAHINAESPVKERDGKQDGRLNQPFPSATSASAMTKRPLPLENFMESASSKKSTIFTTVVAQDGPVIVPEPPKPPSGAKEFECPYCFMILPIAQAKASRWRRHVMGDLEPYICVLEPCSEALLLFRDKNTWLAHMQKAHLSQWTCNSTAHSRCLFASEEEYENHMWTVHEGTFTASQLPLLKRRSKIPLLATFTQCPLCGFVPPEDLTEESKSRDLSGSLRSEVARAVSRLIENHLAGHLEYMSVKALPWQDGPDDMRSEETSSEHTEEVVLQSHPDLSIVADEAASLLSLPDEERDQAKPMTWPDEDGSIGDNVQLEIAYEEEWEFIPRPEYYGHDRDPTLQTFLKKLYLDFNNTADHSQGPRLPTYFVPVQRDKNFFGRDFALKAIHEALSPKTDVALDSKPLTFPRSYTIYAQGGMGKTQVAIQYVTAHRNDFDAVLWIHADNASKVAQDFQDIAVTLGLVSEDSVDATDLSFTRDIVKRWLVNPYKHPKVGGSNAHSVEKASWLLVFDGVEDPDILNEFWPYDGPGSILITSRNPYSWSTSLLLRPFTIHEATEYLLHLTGRDVSSEEESKAVNTIASRLGGLPLGLTQMGAIIVHKKLSFSQFLKSYEERGAQHELLHWRTSDPCAPQLSNYEHNVASVWAFDNLTRQGNSLLNIFSMLDPDGIPEGIFSTDFGGLATCDFPRSYDEWKSARNELLARSLVFESKQDKKLFLHRLVQDVARSRMSQLQLHDVFLTSVTLVSNMWPFETFTWRHGVARWAVCEQLFPHILKLKDIFPQVSSTDSFEDYPFARLLVDAGWYNHERGNYADAVVFNNMAQSICESLQLRITEHPELLSEVDMVSTARELNSILGEINHNRGCIATETNEPCNALRYHEIFNNMMVKEFEEEKSSEIDDMRLAISWNELGNAYMLNQKWSRGEDCFQESIKLIKRMHDFKDTWVSLPVANLGLAYWLQGRHKDAYQTLMQGLKAREVEFGMDDRISFITGRFLHALGNVKASQGLLEESSDYHRRALLHYKSTLGNRHHRTADAVVKVAEHNIRLQQYEVALALLDHALKAYSDANHYFPEKARASYKRVKALRGLKKTAEVDVELSECFNIYTRLMAQHRQMALGTATAVHHKTDPSQLEDQDFDDFVTFWSK